MKRYQKHQSQLSISRQSSHHQSIAHSPIDATISINFQYAATFQQSCIPSQDYNIGRRMIGNQDSLQLSKTLLIQSSFKANACANIQQNGLITSQSKINEAPFELADSCLIFDQSRLNKKQQQKIHYLEVQNQLDELCPYSSDSLHIEQQSLENETKIKFGEEFESRMEQIRLKFHEVEEKVFNSKKLNLKLEQNEGKEKMFYQFSFEDSENNKQNIDSRGNQSDSVMPFGIMNSVYQNLQIRGLKNKDEELIVSILLKLGYLKEEQIFFGVDHNESNRLTNLIKQARYNYYEQSIQKQISNNKTKRQPNSIQNYSQIQQFQQIHQRNSEQSDVSLSFQKFNQNTYGDRKEQENPIELNESLRSVSILQNSGNVEVSPFECWGNVNNFPYQPKIITRVNEIKKEFEKLQKESDQNFFIRVENSNVLNSACFNRNFESQVIQGQLQAFDEECFYNMESEQSAYEGSSGNLLKLFENKRKSEFMIEFGSPSKQNQNGQQNNLGTGSQGSVFRAFYIPEGDQKLKQLQYKLSNKTIQIANQKQENENSLLNKDKDHNLLSYINTLRNSNFFTNICHQHSPIKQNSKASQKLKKLLSPFSVKRVKKCYRIKNVGKISEKENCRFDLPLFIVSKNKLRKDVKI